MAFKSGFIKSRFYTALGLLFLLIFIGTTGFILIADYEWVNALYMTVITISTVGFKEVEPLDSESKIFTIFLIITSITLFGYIISVITDYIANNKFIEELKMKQVQKRIQKLENHTIVCGFGRNGKQAMAKLGSYNKGCVIVESNPDLIEEIELQGDMLYVRGDATNDEVLMAAGIDRAASLITTLPSDADNLYVVLSARQLNDSCIIVSRASIDTSYKKLKVAGADNVIMPDKLGGAHMASLVVTPDIIEFIDRLSIEGESSSNIEELVIENLPEEYTNKSILDLDLRKRTGCTVIGFKTPDKEYMINPDASTILVPKSKLIVIGRPEEIQKLNKLF
ncbi:potassium channel protein [Lutimonas saemankumensis]|uniref:potassium channel family protein n=1 Tax=Lutimonas saemankumensis TaxID=483016 RepID=UPI001CD4F811|nr:potassium channel protein [Lutimonas saemankumensis]MCA0933936.1 potassium channel protein [Lutimonas saemankumensis]